MGCCVSFQYEQDCAFSQASWADIHTSYDFYGLYLATLLLSRDLNEAKYLWKRAPAAVKTAGEISQIGALWEVGKAIWNENTAAAVLLLDKTPWNASLRRAVPSLRLQLLEDSISLLSQTTSGLRLSTVLQSLPIAEEEAISILAGMGAEVGPEPDRSVQLAQTVSKRTATQSQSTDAASIAALQQYTEVLAMLDQKPLKVEVPARPAAQEAT